VQGRIETSSLSGSERRADSRLVAMMQTQNEETWRNAYSSVTEGRQGISKQNQ
jgi:hypothetical protein